MPAKVKAPTDDSKPPESKIRLAARMIGALACFLVITIIFWELAFLAVELSRWLQDKGWPVFGLAAKVGGVLLALLVVVMTVTVFVVWVVQFARFLSHKEP